MIIGSLEHALSAVIRGEIPEEELQRVETSVYDQHLHFSGYVEDFQIISKSYPINDEDLEGVIRFYYVVRGYQFTRSGMNCISLYKEDKRTRHWLYVPFTIFPHEGEGSLIRVSVQLMVMPKEEKQLIAA